MKKTSLIIMLIAGLLVQHVSAQDKTVSQLLSHYYHIKDALVAGNGAEASNGATEFIKSINGVDNKIISEGNVQSLVKDASKIADTKDINKQRQFFSSFSSNMAALAKATKLSSQPVYLQYCPMKKASWLSNEKEIKNPYYGNSMLTCGKVTETIQ